MSRVTRHAVVLALALALVPTTSSQTIFVNAAAAPGGDGLTWATAYDDLQLALGAAAPGTQIWVAQGTYKPAGPGGSRSSSFQLASGVVLYGGFIGVEIVLAQRSPLQNTTILSGDLNGDDLPGFQNNSDNSYHVVDATGVDATAVLDGFTIVGGNANGPIPDERGAGCLAAGGAPLIANCTFLANIAANDGGGIFNQTTSATVIGCRFLGNWAANGGGMFCHSNSPTIVGSSFSGNTAEDEGAGIMVVFGSAAVTNCTFATNNAATGAGVNFSVSTGSVTSSIFWGNTDQGASVELAQIRGTPTVNTTTVQGWTGALGGILNDGTDPLFVNALGADGIVGSADDDLRLSPGSMAIDAGDNLSLPADVADLDHDGNTGEPLSRDASGRFRVVDDPAAPDTGLGAAPLVDRGAFESQDPARPFPGTDDDLQLQTPINGAGATTGIKSALPNDVLGITILSPGGGMNGAPIIFGLDVFFTGPLPTGFPALPGVWLPPTFTTLIGPPAIMPPGGITFVQLVPPGLGGISALLQCVAVSASSQNGLYAATDAHELQFQ